ncbi:MAG: DNA polymerase III subunit beta [Anaerolineales bacterium]|nr:DNA polymerase III subunit beta [Anaerolineales bacterium]MCA9927887.1 DNA polymerase III subunit beta [Anaerolineales bacterium]
MKLSCLQENLAKGLSIVGRAVSTRSTLPVLANVLLATDNGRLKLSATNLEIVVTCWIGAKVEEEGSITIPHRTFNDLISTLPQDRVDLELNVPNQTMHITCARTEANVKGIDAQEFPLIPEPDQKNRIRIETDVFRQMINQVAMAAATDDTRPTLTGVSTTFEGSQILMVATDGFRLSMRSAHIPGFVEQSFDVIIPARALLELARIAGDDNEAVYVSLPEGRNQIIFDMDNIVLVSQLVDGNFPDYSPIIPKSCNTRSILGTAEFRKACRTAEIFARESSHTARVRIEPGGDLLPGSALIAATSTETGSNEAQIDATVDGEPIEIAFNVKYMTDVLNVIDTPQVALETTNPMEPGVIKPVGDNDFIHIIMPMHFGR